MPNLRQLFLQHVAQTSEMPLMLEVEHANGMYVIDRQGKEYMDLNSGICVSSLGHCHPAVVEAVEEQAGRFMHTMVYGEHVQAPQVQYAHLLCGHLPDSLNSVYFVNTGTEAVEVAMKLSKRVTGRSEIVACENAYHGSTQGSESLRSDEDYKRAFRPLLPGIRHIRFNRSEDINQITEATACVILEPVQAESGVRPAESEFMKSLRERCDKTGTLLVLDEIQTGFGRTGSLFAFQHYGIVPDILLIAKSMGGGMPIGAMVASSELTNAFTKKPALGHISTFGGHPVSCAAAYAMLKTLLDEELVGEVGKKADLFRELLVHPLIHEVRGKGLMMAVELTKKRYLKYVVEGCLKRGILIDWFLFYNQAFRLAPPLIISEDQIREACSRILAACEDAAG